MSKEKKDAKARIEKDIEEVLKASKRAKPVKSADPPKTPEPEKEE